MAMTSFHAMHVMHCRPCAGAAGPADEAPPAARLLSEAMQGLEEEPLLPRVSVLNFNTP